MAVTPTFPGVYVQEVPSGVRTITGVSTSIALFIGTTQSGPMFDPIRRTTYTDFVRAFSDDTSAAQLPNYVKLFFLNGGTDCYVMRIANGATKAAVALQNELGAEVLTLTAKNAGVQSENIRAVVTYGGPQPETTFNLDLFEWQFDANGNRTKVNTESWKGLNMDPASPLFAPTYITQNSKLLDAALGSAVPPAIEGPSISGRAVDITPGFQAAWKPLLGNSPGVKTNKVQISVNGSPYVEVDLSPITVGTAATNLITDIQNAIADQFAALGFPGVNVVVSFPAVGASSSVRVRIDPATPTGDILIRPGSSNDLAVPLMLGTAQGGLEISSRWNQRPAPNGITFRPTPSALDDFAVLAQNGLANIVIDVQKPDGTFVSDTVPMTGGPLPSIQTTGAADPMSKDAKPVSPNGHSDGVREKLGIIAQRIAQFVPTVAGNKNKWKTSVANYRLTLMPTDDVPDNFVSSNFSVPASTLAPHFPTPNVHYYTVGIGGNNAGRQTSASSAASNGNPPLASDYANAYLTVDKEVDLFNLLVLPPDVPGKDMSAFYGDASVFCQQRSAVLLMDPQPGWVTASDAATQVVGLRVGLVKDFAALFYPRITIVDSGVATNIGPAGAVAGLCARIDGTRGVWKAPAGTEVDLRGVIGVEHKFSDSEHGIMNPRAVNVIRVFPNGIVNFGARTMDGDDDFGSEYKYIPIRRLALYIEVSLYRGLKWVVFEPNDEPLWAQIRLNVGAFMHDLFVKGAFQGRTPKDAYFVKCDAETTTPNDRNLAIVNIWVGFAPLKPAEFVILYLQQMAGQIQV